MFFPEFSEYEYDEELWPSAFLLESLVRSAVAIRPIDFDVDSKQVMADRLKDLFDCLRPLEEINPNNDEDGLILQFVDIEYYNIKALATRTTTSHVSRPKDRESDLRGSSFQNKLLDYARRSESFRQVFLSGALVRRIEEAETCFRGKKPEENLGE